MKNAGKLTVAGPVLGVLIWVCCFGCSHLGVVFSCPHSSVLIWVSYLGCSHHLSEWVEVQIFPNLAQHRDRIIAGSRAFKLKRVNRTTARRGTLTGAVYRHYSNATVPLQFKRSCKLKNCTQKRVWA